MRASMIVFSVIVALGCANSTPPSSTLTPEVARQAIVSMLSDPETIANAPPDPRARKLLTYLSSEEYLQGLMKSDVKDNGTDILINNGEWKVRRANLTFRSTFFTDEWHDYQIIGDRNCLAHSIATWEAQRRA